MTTKSQDASHPAGASLAATAPPSRAHMGRGKSQISTMRIEDAGFRRNVWRAYPEEGTPYETVLSEAYWAHRARNFRAGDKIEILPDEMHYYAELLVIASGATWARVTELFRKDLGTTIVPDRQSDYRVAWRGAHRKFAIVRTVDGAIVKDGFAQQHEAELALPHYHPRANS
jgi:hypothetical protein